MFLHFGAAEALSVAAEKCWPMHLWISFSHEADFYLFRHLRKSGAGYICPYLPSVCNMWGHRTFPSILAHSAGVEYSGDVLLPARHTRGLVLVRHGLCSQATLQTLT